MKYRFLILNTYHPGIIYLQEQGGEDPWLFSETQRGLRAKMFGKHPFRASEMPNHMNSNL